MNLGEFFVLCLGHSSCRKVSKLNILQNYSAPIVSVAWPGAACPSKPVVVTDVERLHNFVSFGRRIVVIFLRHVKVMNQIGFVVCLGSAGCISDYVLRPKNFWGFSLYFAYKKPQRTTLLSFYGWASLWFSNGEIHP